MDCQMVLSVFTLFAGMTSVMMLEVTRSFNCCHLPFVMSINRSLEQEIYVGNRTMAIASRSTFNATPPFTVQGNSELTMGECKDFDQKIVFENMRGFAEEKNIHYHSLRCNNTTPNNQPQGPAGQIVGIFVGVVVAGVILAGIGLWCFKQLTSNGTVRFLRCRADAAE